MTEDQDPQEDLLNILADGEDDFDVDLMSTGCRYASSTGVNLTFEDITRLYNFDQDDLIKLLGTLADAGQLDETAIFDMVQKVAKGEVDEPTSDIVKLTELRRAKR